MVFSRRTIAFSLTALALLAGGLALGEHRSSAPPYDRPAPRMAALSARDRVLVVAPHPDDESVGCGGLIASAVAAGAAVQVVYVTNGDAFRTAAQKLFSEKSVPSQDYEKLAQMRQREASAALAKLGVDGSHAVFLGYPDRGIDQLWLRNWDVADPYTSRYTKTDHGPYGSSLRQHAPYAGRALVDDLESAIRSFRPTMVVAPHPRDIHGDHWSSYCFTVAALYELKLLDRVKLWLYLVHTQNRWLSPSGRLLDPTAAPAMPDEFKTQWYTLPLTADEARRKRAAIGEHSTQLLIMKDWLMNFARQRELYGHVPVATFGGFGPVLQRKQPPGGRRAAPEGTIIAMRMGLISPGLWIGLDTARQPSAKVECRAHLHLLHGGRVGPPETYVLRPRSGKPRQSVEVVVASVPHDVGAVMCAADTWRGSAQLDRIGWAMVRVY